MFLTIFINKDRHISVKNIEIIPDGCSFGLMNFIDDKNYSYHFFSDVDYHTYMKSKISSVSNYFNINKTEIYLVKKHKNIYMNNYIGLEKEEIENLTKVCEEMIKKSVI